MGAKIKKIRGKFYICVNYKGRRKTKMIGTNQQVAEIVKAKVELQLAEGNLGIFSDEPAAEPKQICFADAGEKWLRVVEMADKKNTLTSYRSVFHSHLLPYFSKKPLNKITSDHVEAFLYEKVTQRDEDGVQEYSQNSAKLMFSVLRTLFNYCVSKKWITTNPASSMGKLMKIGRKPKEIQFMSKDEARAFLDAVKVITEQEGGDYYELFDTGFKTGMRRGELLGLGMGDIAFGRFPGDPNAHIMVRNNFTRGEDITPKSNKPRRIDLANELRGVLIEMRDRRTLAAMMKGENDIAEQFAFTNADGSRITPVQMEMVMNRALDAAGLRRYNRHSIRHSFGAWMTAAGVTPAYIQLQMGHSSVKITIDTYGHLAPGSTTSWINAVSLTQVPAAEIQKDANPTQTRELEEIENSLYVAGMLRDNSGMMGSGNLTCAYTQFR